MPGAEILAGSLNAENQQATSPAGHLCVPRLPAASSGQGRVRRSESTDRYAMSARKKRPAAVAGAGTVRGTTARSDACAICRVATRASTWRSRSGGSDAHCPEGALGHLPNASNEATTAVPVGAERVVITVRGTTIVCDSAHPGAQRLPQERPDNVCVLVDLRWVVKRK